MLRIINGEAVRALYQIEHAVPDMARALTGFSSGQTYQHPRLTVEPPESGGMVLIMPAAAGDKFGLKILRMFPRSAERGLPGVQGLVILVDAVHGEPLAVIDGTAVTEIRTAAVTALATDSLAPADATTLGVIGAGVQARGHLAGLAGTRPWKTVRLYGPRRERAEALAIWAQERGIPVEVAGSAREAVREADVICTVTSACSPVLADADVADRKVHINAIGSFGPTCRELPTQLMARARVIVDSREAALAEAGEVIVPQAEGALAHDIIAAELGQVLSGDRPGRMGDEVTVFKSLGLPIEDVMACETIYRRAVETGAGDLVSFP